MKRGKHKSPGATPDAAGKRPQPGASKACAAADKRPDVHDTDLYADIVVQSGDIVISTDREERIVRWNEEAERVFGYTSDEILGRPFEYVFPLADGSEDRRRFDVGRIVAGKNFAGGFQGRHKDGAKLAIYLYATAARNESGQSVGVTCVGREVTGFWRAEQVIAATEERYHLLLRATPHPVLFLSRLGRIIDTNPAADRFAGLAHEDNVGRLALHAVIPEERRRAAELFRRLVRESRVEGRLRCQTPAGIRTVECSAARVDTPAEPCYFFLCRDVTERARAESAAHETTEKYRGIFSAIKDGVFLETLDGTILDANDSACRMLGYTHDELLQRNTADLVPERARGGFATIRESLLRYGEYRGESFNLRRDGSEFPVDVSCSLLTIEGRTHALVVVRDATERRRAAAALLESEANFHALADNASDGIFIGVGSEARHSYVNTRGCEITGYSAEELLHMGPRELAHPDELPRLMDRYRKRLQGEPVPHQYETRILRRDGAAVPVEITASRTNWQGEPADIIILRDISERKRAEAELRHMADTAMELVRLGADADIYDFVCRRLPDLVGDAVLAVNSYDAAGNSLTTRRIVGLSARETERLSRLIGADISKIRFTGLPRPALEQLCAGRLTRIEDGLYGVFFHQVPVPVCAEITRLTGMNEAWSIGLRRDDQLYGNITILPRTKRPVPSIIEAFAGQVSIAIERQQAERNARREHETAARYLDVAEVVMVALDRSAIVTMINRKGLEVIGLPREQVVGQPWLDKFVPEPARSAVKEVFAEVMAGKRETTEYHENEIITARGIRLIAWHNALLKDEAGRSTGTLSSGEDITERRAAEKELAESRRRTDTLFSNLPGMAYRCANDPDWTVKFVSEGALGLTGYRPDELVGNRVTSYGALIHPVDRELVWQEVQAAVEAREPFEITYRIRTRDGTDKRVWEQGRGVFDPHGELLTLEGYITDITGFAGVYISLQASEKQLRESEEKYSSLFEGVPIGLYRTSPDGRVLLVNPALARMLGFESVEELLQRNLEQGGFGPSYERRAFRQRIEQEGEITGLEVAWTKKDGTLIYVRENARLVRSPDGTVLYYEGTVEDVSTQKLTYAKLYETEERYHKLFDLSPDGVAVHQDGRIVLVNRAAARALGYDRPDELAGKPVLELIHPEDLPMVTERIRKTIETGSPAPPAQERLRRKDGSYVRVEVANSPVPWYGRTAILVVARVLDSDSP